MDNVDDIDVDIQQLKIGTFNVNGIRSNIMKREAIFQSIKELKFNVIALQETHLLDEDLQALQNIWQGPIIISEGTSNSKGLCILFDRYFDDDKINITFKNDRILICDCKIGTEVIYFCNIYAPNDDTQKIRFYNDLNYIINDKIKDFLIQKVVIFGDFNCVLDNALDVISGKPHPRETVNAFNYFVDENQLTDIWRKNSKFLKDYTWSGGGNQMIARRLDFIFASPFLLPLITDCQILSVGHSDHRIVISDIEFNYFERGKGNYKMNASIFENENFKLSIKALIEESKVELQDLDPILKWESIKIKVREHIQLFGKYNNFKKREETRNLRNRLLELERELANNISDTLLQKEVHLVKNKLEILNLEKANAAKLRAKIQWIEDGEKCTKFFLALEKHRGVSNTVYQIKDKNGILKTRGSEIVSVFAEHFSQVFTNYVDNNKVVDDFNEFISNINLKKLNDADRNNIDKCISIEELHISLKSLNKTASPGIDGFCMEFYLIFFDEIKNLLLDYYNACFEQKALSLKTQLGMISLIHKGKGLKRNEVNNWRPITLSTIDYKLIAKLLSNRVKNIIGSLVGKQQQGFVKGRNIANIIRSIDDVLEYEREKNLNDLLFIIDFKQAFDKINTHYICEVFKKFGFGDYFVGWLKTLFANRQSCVQNGGHVSSLFKVESGVKQGCPIAPILFVLAAEILAQNIIQDNSIKGVSYPYCHEQIKIQQFADDTSFFCKTLMDIREILSRIKAFGIFSGLNININKCAIMPMGLGNVLNENTIDIKMTEQVKIVGIVFRKDKGASEIQENWNSRILKIKQTIKNWMKRNLTVIGKIQVIKTFLLSQFVYVLQSLALPLNVLDEINSIFYRFIWRKKDIDKRAWERLRRRVLSNDKEHGGLNMINIQDFQNSFLIKWAIDLNKGELENWKYFPMYFYKKLGGLSVFKSNVELKNFIGLHDIKSIFWNRVLMVWIMKNKKVENITIFDPIHNNQYITLNNETIFIRRAIENDIILIKDMLDANGNIKSFQEYSDLVGLNPNNLIEYVKIKTAISKVIEQIQIVEKNSIIFNNINIESLNRKKVYSIINMKETGHGETLWNNKMGKKLDEYTWSNIFSCTKEIKLQDFQWKVVHNIFPTNILLTRMGIKKSEKCEICGVTDFVEHMFYECQRIAGFWKSVEQTISMKVNKTIKLSLFSILLGIEQDRNYKCLNKKDTYVINEILIIAKHSISISKKHKTNTLTVFEKEMSLRKLMN